MSSVQLASVILLWIVYAILAPAQCQFVAPDLIFQAYYPKGLRVVIPGDSKTELVAFHGKINQPIGLLEPGDISQDILRSPNNNLFVYIDPEIELKKNDTLYYWIFIQHDQLGYRRDNLSWTVKDLLPLEELRKPGTTSFINKSIIDYWFIENPISEDVWKIEEYIPGRPDWPYNIYQNDPTVIKIENGVLHIMPQLRINNTRIKLNLGDKCSRVNVEECFRDGSSIWNPPIVSGQLRSKKSFRFGSVTIKAKLPIGDYVYPEIYLEDENHAEKKIFVAFARGNKNYELNGNDIGGKTLYGGPCSNISNIEEHTKIFSEHVGNDWHVFTVNWTSGSMQLFVDDENYANISSLELRNLGFNKSGTYRLVLGVGIAGPYVFPENYRSSGRRKPYKNLGRDGIKSFTVNRQEWIDTWTDETQLKVELVSVSSV